MIHSVMFKVKVYLSFVSHVKSQTVNKKGSPYIFHYLLLYLCMTHQFVFSFCGKILLTRYQIGTQ